MAENKDFLEIAHTSIEVFKDGKLDYHELEKLLDIALKDGSIDDNEKRVLGNIFLRLTDAELTTTIKSRIDEVKQRHNI